jgi:DNA-binding NtrC family response regulator
MSITVVLAIGMDSWMLEAQRKAWQSAGYFVTSAGSIRDAIDDFHGGDFDLVLISNSIPAETRDRLTSMIRATGSRVPVVCVTNSPSDWESFADATKSDSNDLLQRIRELLVAAAAVAQKPTVGTTMHSRQLKQA